MNEANQTTTASGSQNLCVYDYRCDMEPAMPKDVQVFRGEAVEILVSMYDDNTLQVGEVSAAAFYWQKPEMSRENQWWDKAATINGDGGISVIFDSRTMDDGASQYQWFLGLATPDGLNTRAHGTIHMQYGIGIPNELPLPAQIIDFDVVEVLNPPWVPLIEGESSARASADSALGTRINGKADKVPGAVSGDFAALDASGNLVDSGWQPSGFAKATDLPGFETWTFEVDVSGTTQTVTKKVAIYPQP